MTTQQTLLILGGGTAGTMVANKLSHHLDLQTWRIVVVDKDPIHYYQPGFLFMPFGIYKPEDVVRLKKHVLDHRVEVVFSHIDEVDTANNRVMLSIGSTINYDYLVIATGTDIEPAETEGLLGDGWQHNIFDFYTYEGSKALTQALDQFERGRLVVNVVEMPIKCPVAPLEFSFLADWYFTQRGIRNQVEIVYATPLSGAFTKPIAASRLGNILENKGIMVETDFNAGSVDASTNTLASWDGREIPYDLLVTVPTNMGAAYIEASNLGDDLRFVPTDKFTLQAEGHENIFVIGDAANVPTSKAGSVAHFELEILVENLLAHMHGEDLTARFDGHANCFIETGFNKGILIDFNYDTQPLPGTFPFAGIGPMQLLEESVINHIGKMSFKWIYWNLLLHGRDIPTITNQMTLKGKHVELM